jgi:hypothetical protein
MLQADPHPPVGNHVVAPPRTILCTRTEIGRSANTSEDRHRAFV